MITYKMKKIVPFILLALASCKDAEYYFEEVKTTPEVLANYALVYQTGDMMTMKGRLNPDNGLIITVGGAKADYKVLKQENELDVVSFPITETMGAGKRAITISSGGKLINAPAIEVISTKGQFAEILTMVEHTTLNTNDIPFYCRNGKGDIYIFRSSGNKIEHVRKDGTIEMVLTLSGKTDQYGTWAVKTMYSGGVDSKGEYLYFSALTTDNSSDNSRNDIYRLVRYKLNGTEAPETLNRSLYHTFRNRDRTLASIQPFEGDIKEVKIFQTGGIFPDAQGNVYIQLSNYATCLLNVNGQFNYLFVSWQPLITESPAIAWMPQVWDTQAGELFSGNRLGLPGAHLDVIQGTISPDDRLMYFIYPALRMDGAQTIIKLYDLTYRSLAYVYTKSTYIGEKQYVAGPFNILTGVRSQSPSGADVDQTGFMTMPGAKLLLLYYAKTYGIMDFHRKYGENYATIKMAKAEFMLGRKDISLNYDEEGMIYTTTNNRSMILKSKKM